MSQNIRKRFCKSSHSVAKPCNNSLRFAKLSLIHQNISGSSCLHHKLSYKRASQGSTKRRNLLISKMFKGEISSYQILQYSYLSKKCGFQGLHYLIHPRQSVSDTNTSELNFYNQSWQHCIITCT